MPPESFPYPDRGPLFGGLPQEGSTITMAFWRIVQFNWPVEDRAELSRWAREVEGLRRPVNDDELEGLA